MYTDTHCHVYHEYYDSIDNVIKEAKDNHVDYFIVSGCNSKANKEVIDTINNYSSFYGCIGLHPEEADMYYSADLKFIENNLGHAKILAIGEIGLDYHYTKDNKEKQKTLFEAQLTLAQKYNMPVVIHSREATEDTITILKKYPDVKGVIHSFSGSFETAKIYTALGYKLGINGVVTFKNSHLKEILPEIINDIVLETDSPFLTPHPYRGTKNAPKYIKNIADFICECMGITESQLVSITNQNIKAIFDK